MSIQRTLSALALAMALAACDSPLSDPLGDARAAFDGQDYLAARDAAQAALRDAPEDMAALELLVRAQLATGDGVAAEATLARIARLGAPLADAALLQAEALLQQGQSQEALRLIEGETTAEAWRLRGLAAALDGDGAGALAAFAQGRGAAGDKARLYAAEASFHLGQGNADAAREAVGLAQQAAPDRIETYFITARLAQLDGQAELAARAFLAILEIAPNDRPALLGAIAEMGELGRVDLVRPLVARGREGYPADPEFVFLEARLLAEDGNWQGARDLLQAHEAELVAHPDSRGLYGEALLELGQLELARSHLAALNRQYPGNPQITRTYARLLLEAGEPAAARALIAPLAASPQALPQDRELAARAAGR